MTALEDLRVGLGIDLHRLVAGRACVLGGVTVPAPVGPDAHSDGDVILHALCDALLGAAGLPDLGTLFPDSDPRHKGRSSSEFVRDVMNRVQTLRWRVLNADIVVECEQPKIAPQRQAICTRIAQLLQVTEDRVNLRGKTGEKCDAIGRGEAIRATAVVLLAR